MKCKKCNSENEENAQYCQNCGEELKSKKPKKKLGKFTKIGLGVLGIIILIVAVMMLTSTPGVTKFDKALIDSVNDGAPAESLIPYIKNSTAISEQGAKSQYNSQVSFAQSMNNDTFRKEAQVEYDESMNYIHQTEEVQISFVKGEISEEKFIKELMRLYKEENG